MAKHRACKYLLKHPSFVARCIRAEKSFLARRTSEPLRKREGEREREQNRTIPSKESRINRIPEEIERGTGTVYSGGGGERRTHTYTCTCKAQARCVRVQSIYIHIASRSQSKSLSFDVVPVASARANLQCVSARYIYGCLGRGRNKKKERNGEEEKKDEYRAAAAANGSYTGISRARNAL